MSESSSSTRDLTAKGITWFDHSRSNGTCVCIYEDPRIIGLWPFSVTRGHWNQHESFGCLWLPSCYWSVVTMDLSRTVSNMNGNFQSKSQIFPTYLQWCLKWQWCSKILG